MGGRGSAGAGGLGAASAGRGRGMSLARFLSQQDINRANAASMTDMGDIIKRTFERNAAEINGLELFIRHWNTPDKYIPKLSQFAAVCSPDFSTYTDMPLAIQIYNHYRKHWMAAYWQLHGMTVYPTISWSDEDSYSWCFDGEPQGGIVAVSSVGTQANTESKRLFLRGYEEMMKRLSPEWVIFYGRVPEECDWNVIRIKPHYDDIVKRRRAVSG